MALRHIVLVAAFALALFVVKPQTADAGVHVRVGPGAVYVGPGYGYYGYHRPYYRPYYRPRAYYYPRYYQPRYYYPAPRYYKKKWRRRW